MIYMKKILTILILIITTTSNAIEKSVIITPIPAKDNFKVEINGLDESSLYPKVEIISTDGKPSKVLNAVNNSRCSKWNIYYKSN